MVSRLFNSYPFDSELLYAFNVSVVFRIISEVVIALHLQFAALDLLRRFSDLSFQLIRCICFVVIIICNADRILRKAEACRMTPHRIITGLNGMHDGDKRVTDFLQHRSEDNICLLRVLAVLVQSILIRINADCPDIIQLRACFEQTITRTAGNLIEDIRIVVAGLIENKHPFRLPHCNR